MNYKTGDLVEVLDSNGKWIPAKVANGNRATDHGETHISVCKFDGPGQLVMLIGGHHTFAHLNGGIRPRNAEDTIIRIPQQAIPKLNMEN